MQMTPKAARFYDRFPDNAVSCQLCPHTCFLRNGGVGTCGARKNRNGTLQALTYGEVTGAAVDPVEKKPLYHFHPGSRIYSVGAWGCNLKCIFCQNSAISQAESPTVPLSPAEVAKNGMADGSIGVAYTYNEPLIAMEYLIDCCKAVRKLGGKNVIVSNGYVNRAPLEELLPWADAFNIDVKAFNNDFYKRMCGAKLEPVLDTVAFLSGKVHMELTTLLIPEANDAIPELEDLADWISENCGRSVPCHLTAYHPELPLRRGGDDGRDFEECAVHFSEKVGVCVSRQRDHPRRLGHDLRQMRRDGGEARRLRRRRLGHAAGRKLRQMRREEQHCRLKSFDPGVIHICA